MATPNNQFRLRLYPNTYYNFIVNWGDGTSDVFNGTTPTYQGATGSSSTWFTQISTISASWPGITHTYDLAGKYTIKISEIVSGGFAGLQYIGIDDNPHDNSYAWHPTNEYNHDAKKVTAVSQWGSIKWNPTKAMKNSFEGCVNLKDVVTDGGTSTLSALSSLNRAWFFCSTLSSFGAIDTSNVIDFDNAWSSCPNLRISFPLINTSKGTSFLGTWYGCGLTAFPALDMNKASQLLQTWEGCGNMLTFATTAISACTFLYFTWKDCRKLKEFPLIDTRNVTSCDRVWENCDALTAFPLIDMSKNTGRLYACWNDCDNLITFPMLDTKSVYDFGYAWNNCYALKSFPLIDTSKGTNFDRTWSNCRSLTSFPIINVLSSNSLNTTWYNCISLSEFPLIDTSKIKNFYATWAADYPYYPNLSMSMKSFNNKINTLSGEQFEWTWRGNREFTSFPSLSFDNAKVLYATWMGCDSLTSFPLINVKKATSVAGAWYYCSGLTSFPTLSFDSCTDFTRTWSNCIKLSSFPEIITPNANTFECAFGRGRNRDSGYSFSLLNPMTAIPSFFLKSSNTSKATNFRNTWSNFGRLLSFPDTIDMRNATNVAGAWGHCISLTTFPNIMLSSVQYFGIGNNTPNAPGAAGPNIEGFNQDGGGSYGFPWSDAWIGGEGAWMHCRFTSFPQLCTQNGIDFSHAWYCNKSLSAFPLLNTSKGKYFVSTWRGCSAIKDFPKMDFSSANDVRGAFSFMYSLTSFPEIDLSKCVYFGGAWNNCRNLVTFPQINTVSATSLQHPNFGDNFEFGGAWENCYSLTAFPMIDTSNVTNFRYAWKNCYSLSASPFPTLNMSKMSQSYDPGFFGASYGRYGGEGGDGCFQGVKLQTQSYSALLTSLCATNFNSNVQFHGGLSNFNQAGKNARDYLVNTKGWTIGGTGVLEP